MYFFVCYPSWGWISASICSSLDSCALWGTLIKEILQENKRNHQFNNIKSDLLQ